MHTGQAPVSVYFKPKPVEAAPEEREATFRGRRLRGRVVQPPPGYKGAVLADTRDASVADDEERRWLYKRSFDSFTLWQHDDLPHDEEPVLKSMRWARIWLKSQDWNDDA